MGRVFISAGHGGYENGQIDPGVITGGITEAQEMILLRDRVMSELQARKVSVLSVPDDLSQQQTLDWINNRAKPDDVAVELHANAALNPEARGTTVYYITNNSERRQEAERLIRALIQQVPQLTNRGARPDAVTGTGSLLFCRAISVPSLYVEVGFLTNPDDRSLIQNRRDQIAAGLADGLLSWVNRSPATPPSQVAYSQIGIRVNGQPYGEPGIAINGNSYVPIALADSFGIDLTQAPFVRRIYYRNIVYVKAIDLREFNIAVGWDNANRAVTLRSLLPICKGQIDRIMGIGNTTDVQLMVFLKNDNPQAIERFPDIATLFREEASVEGVNYDIAFAQMCLETDFLRFGKGIGAVQNNFAGLGDAAGSEGGATFASARIGVRAQIQHLKAYASTEPIVREVVDPRFRFITRGIAPLVGQLSGRWSADLTYGDRILAILRQLYESAGLLQS
ncbi:MAG: N-acetylmuramoyl-L-alanine amidase [Cyanobacteria bacterium SID2]|nr:N-acetylmuramoyl-L-alanine amidase [Cyanobacteria bacterium SID2]MBP0005749.1 N-acetylmuramoyl-L-alanine amidase [Cyanobacteria bacterium SBC]